MVDQTATHIMSEQTATVSEKMDMFQQHQLPTEFDFYATNWVKTGKNWQITLENKFRADIIKRVAIYEQTFFPKRVQEIKDYTLCTIDRALELKAKWLYFLTNEKQPIIRTYVDRLVSAMFGANFAIKVYPVARQNKKKADTVQAAIEWCFSSSKAKKSLVDMWTTAINIWPGFSRCWFMPSEEKVKEIKDPTVKNIRGIQNHYAIFDRVSEFNLFGEPFVPYEDQRDMIYRKVLPINSIIKKIAALSWDIKKEHLEFIVKNPKPFSLKNYDKIRLIKYYEDYALNTLNFQIDNLFQLTLDNNHSEYCERWTEDNLVLFLNGYIVYDWVNPLKKVTHKVHPFKKCGYTRSPWVRVADWVWTMLAGQQKLYDALYNLSFDLIKFKAGPMFLLQPGQFIEWSEKILNYEPFTFKQIRGPGKIETLEMPSVDPGVITSMTNILDMANFTVSPSNYNQLQGVARSATDSNLRYEWLSDALKPLIGSMNEMLTDTAEDWIEYMKEYMPEEFEVPVFGDDGSVNEWKTIKQKDLEWKYIYEFEFESIKDINKIVERSQFTEIVNAVKTLGQDPVTQRRQVKNSDLLRNWLDMFNQDPNMVLWEDEYYKMVEDAKKKAIDMEVQLMLYTTEAKKLLPQEPQMGWGQWQFQNSPQWWGYQQWGWVYPYTPKQPAEAGPTWWTSEVGAAAAPWEVAPPMNIAEVMKAAAE